MEEDQKNPILKEGFLVKRGHVVHNWKARWFVLYPDQLLYYKYDGGKRDSCQRGRIMLTGCKISCPYLEYDNRPLVFKLQTKSSAEYFLEACSREERDQWAADIGAAVEKLRPADSPTPSQSKTTGYLSLQLHSFSLNQVVDSMYDVHSGIKLTSHNEQGSSYSNCFSGSAVVDWLVFNQLALTRVEAVTLSSAVLEEGYLRPVGLRSVEAQRSHGLSEQFLDDSTALYSFSENFKKRGSVKAETSLSAMELSGKVLKRGYLLKQDDISPVGGFSLRGCLVSALDDNGVPSGVKGKVQGNLLKIITQFDTHYYIQAPSRQERMDWIEAIRGQS
ncbi:pleckstrin-2 isoform X1 [Oncorhynchus masou masou]|uniref:pleckstrin-2 isoform X1 n=1 Tax=Oncorhynchus masou masou TaxID=90313 RepID=UPI003183D4CE